MQHSLLQTQERQTNDLLNQQNHPTKTSVYPPIINTENIMPRSLVFGLAGAALALMTALPNPALAVQHGCTPPTAGPKSLTIKLQLGGKKSRITGRFCKTVGKAKAIVSRARFTKRGKKVALGKLYKAQIKGVEGIKGKIKEVRYI